MQVGLVVRDALALGLAAREGARAAAVAGRVRDAEAAVRAADGPLEAARIEIAVTIPSARGEPARVALAYEERLRVPVVDRVVDTRLPLRARAVMRLEVAPSPTPP